MQQRQTALPETSGTQVVEDFFDAWRAMDVARVLDLVSDDIVYHNGPFKPLRGKARVERVFRAYFLGVDAFEIEFRNIAEQDGIVLTERQDRAVGRWLDMSFWACGTFEVREGKIVFWRDYFDPAAVVVQLLTSPFRRLATRLSS